LSSYVDWFLIYDVKYIFESVATKNNGYHGNALISQPAPNCGDVIRQFYDPEIMTELLIYDNKCSSSVHTFSLNLALFCQYLQHEMGLLAGLHNLVPVF
jgi:hypothetical protein